MVGTGRGGRCLEPASALRPGSCWWRCQRGAQAAPSAYDADVGLDPGHSRADVGASGSGVGEYQHTLDVAMRLKPLLEQSGLSVALSRTDDSPLTAMSHPDVTERTRIEQTARIAAVGNVRIFVSIHSMAARPRYTVPRPTTTATTPALRAVVSATRSSVIWWTS